MVVSNLFFVNGGFQLIFCKWWFPTYSGKWWFPFLYVGEKKPHVSNGCNMYPLRSPGQWPWQHKSSNTCGALTHFPRWAKKVHTIRKVKNPGTQELSHMRKPPFLLRPVLPVGKSRIDLFLAGCAKQTSTHTAGSMLEKPTGQLARMNDT